MSLIYFDNAATTKVDEQVVQTMLPFLTEHYGNPSSIHGLGRRTRAAVEKARKVIAGHLNASTAEIFFTSGGTESNNMVLKNCVRDLGVTCLISSKIEHHCVLHTVENLEEAGLKVAYVDVNEQGFFDLEHLKQLLKAHQSENVLVSLIHANNEIGTINDLAAIGEICKEYDALFHADTVQTIAHFPLDLTQINVHFVSASAHKFHGPKGVGFVYISGDTHLKPLIHGGAQERNMRAGTENIAGIVGMAKALEIAYEELEETKAYILELKRYFKSLLQQEIPEVQVNGAQCENCLYTVLNVSFPASIASDMLMFNLDIAGICASAGSACSSGADQGSHVLNAIGVPADRPSIRFSFSKYNTKEEIDIAVAKLKEIIGVPA
ncbi:MAG: cysteine desulfurase [Saprospiraceae bacterium]|nr:cysteine desulfurase [Saprospiraceae bacterium]